MHTVFARVSLTVCTQDFFEAPREHSKIKAQIVSKYVQSWARILSDWLRSKGRTPEVAYIDLFSGPGTYSDGTQSTPMLVLKAAIVDSKLGTSLRTYFNDLNEENTSTLRDAIEELPRVSELRFQPQLTSKQATLELVQSLALGPMSQSYTFWTLSATRT